MDVKSVMMIILKMKIKNVYFAIRNVRLVLMNRVIVHRVKEKKNMMKLNLAVIAKRVLKKTKKMNV